MARSSSVGAAVLASGLVTALGWAQENPSPPPAAKPEAAKAEAVERRTSQDLRCIPGATLRVQLVITRLQNEKKEASLPYTFVVSPRPSATCPVSRVQMRMGVDTPVPVVSFDESDPKKPKSTSVQYKTVGTNIDCSADDLGDGRFKVFLNVENSSTLPGSQARASDELSGFPLFRRFEISLSPILRDGQSSQTVASTDPVTGEVVKIDVSLNAVK
jgi:hypothetical protein